MLTLALTAFNKQTLMILVIKVGPKRNLLQFINGILAYVNIACASVYHMYTERHPILATIQS